ncbi:MAG: NAD(P)/FAD-dependent oxidoreductase [Woeseiaceae bacterium]
MSEQLDCVVIGAGVVGLAVARSLAMAGRYVVVLESEEQPGMHASSRNSEVLHAGLYYPDDSLKAELCVAGNQMAYAYCDEHGVPVDKIGKLIVACSDEDVDKLRAIKAQAERNGVHGLQWLEASEAIDRQPQLSCTAALLSPSTGIIDSHAYMLALQADIEAFGGEIVCDSPVSEIVVHNDGFYVAIESSQGDEFVCNTLVNSAGAHAAAIARALGGSYSGDSFLAKGHYFAYQGVSPFSQLVYPVPSDVSLGIHSTVDLQGSTRFGPDLEFVDDLNYDFDASRKAEFVAAIRNYFPELDAEKLVPGYTGIRPNLAGPGQATADFAIESEEEHGVRGLVNLIGIDSPGLTASLAIGEYVSLLTDDR